MTTEKNVSVIEYHSQMIDPLLLGFWVARNRGFEGLRELPESLEIVDGRMRIKEDFRSDDTVLDSVVLSAA